MPTTPRLVVMLVLLLGAAGCVRQDGRNADCRWPAETAAHPATPRHLSADAEFAEDLAIRYADAHYGLHTPYYVSGAAYEAARDRCMETLFEQVAQQHGVSAKQVAASLGRNRGYIDLAEMLTFAVLYCLSAGVAARMNWRRYSPGEQGWRPGITMALILSLLFAVAGTMAGEVWCGLAETLRIGNGHMSYRLERLLWARHRPELFLAALVIFWLAADEIGRRLHSQLLNQG